MTYVCTMSFFGMPKNVIVNMRAETCAKFKIDINAVPEYIDPQEDTRESFRESGFYRDSTASNFGKK